MSNQNYITEMLELKDNNVFFMKNIIINSVGSYQVFNSICTFFHNKRHINLNLDTI